MKVSTTSWHYRLWRFGRENPRSRPRDLCRYFWHIMLVKILIPTTVAGFALTGIVLLGLAIWNAPVTAAIVIASILLAIAAIVGLVVFVRRAVKRDGERVAERRRRIFLGLEEEVKEPGLFWQWLIARKRKVCPLIEVVEED